MAIISDYHLHSSFSGDSDAPMEAMIEKGISLGLKNMCFTEHMDMEFIYSADQEEGTFELHTDSYLYDLLRLKEKYAPAITVCFGVELGLQPHISKDLSKYIHAYDFDFVIGSSHLCHRKDPYYPSFYEGRCEEEAYREYFSSILENLKTFQNFDIYGHLDYVVRYGPHKDQFYCYDTYHDIFDQILCCLIENEIGLEVNTGSIAYGLKELNPCSRILSRYRQLGGELITIGSDAHTPERLCAGFDRASQILKACGFKYYCIFEKRIPAYMKL